MTRIADDFDAIARRLAELRAGRDPASAMSARVVRDFILITKPGSVRWRAAGDPTDWPEAAA